MTAQEDSIARIETADDCYSLLDDFLDRPSPEAATAFKNSLAFWKPGIEEDQLAKVVSLCNLGHFETQFFQFSNAISSYEKARQLFPKEAKKRYDIIEFCLKPLGTLYTQTNALEEAEYLILEYILLANKDNLVQHEVAGLKNLSVVYQNKGSFQSAISILQQGLKLAPSDEGLLLNLATNYRSLGELAKAEEVLATLLSSTELKAKVYLLKASIELERGLKQEASQSLQTSFDALQLMGEENTRALAKVQLSMAHLEIELGNTAKAMEAIQIVYELLLPVYSRIQGIPHDTELFPENTLMDALDLHGSLLGKENEFEQALLAYEKAFRVSDLLNGPSALQESKLLQQTNWKQRSERCLELLYVLNKRDGGVEWIEKSLQIDAASKSRIVQQEREWRDQLLEKDSSKVASALKNTQQSMAQVAAEINAVAQTGTAATAPLLRLQSQYNELIAEQRELSKRFQEQYGHSWQQPIVSLDQLQERVSKQNETVVSYFVGTNGLYQWVLSIDGPTFERIATGEKEINVIMQYYSNLISFFESSKRIANDPLAFARTANTLYERLDIPKATRLVIIPDGMLGYIPFAALTTTASETMNFHEMPFLVYETQVSYSLSLAAYLDSSEEKRQDPDVLGVFPVFRGTPRSLSYSVNEAEGISEAVTTHLLMEEDATTIQFLKQQEAHTILHISTHARGGTFITPAAIEFRDRLLTVDELYGYNFKRDLVVLSACETGVGKVVKGEGAMSIARAFQYAGTKNTLFSLWKVNDLSTAQLMIHFYEELRENSSYALALHQSKLSYLQDSSIDNAKKSPYYWAAFVYYGESELGETSFNWAPIYIVIGFLLLLLLIKAFYRKKKVT